MEEQESFFRRITDAVRTPGISAAGCLAAYHAVLHGMAKCRRHGNNVGTKGNDSIVQAYTGPVCRWNKKILHKLWNRKCYLYCPGEAYG